MAQYINKVALVAEIERRIKERDFQMKSGCWISSTYMYEDLLDFINTLEVKEINSTDAFIEKACEYMRNHIDQQLTIYHEQTWKKRDEFIEDFKNYMKVCK